MAETCFVEVKVRFFDGTLSPRQRCEQVTQLVKEHIQVTGKFEDISIEIGEHTGSCSPDYCDQTEEGWH